VVPRIRPATIADIPTIAPLIRGLADFERAADEVALDEGRLREHLFGPRLFAEVLLAEEAGAVVGFALFSVGMTAALNGPTAWPIRTLFPSFPVSLSTWTPGRP
jgi:hypothetical protein